MKFINHDTAYVRHTNVERSNQLKPIKPTETYWDQTYFLSTETLSNLHC